jgi:hypothetical protein
MEPGNNEVGNQIDGLFASYKAAVPDPEPGVNFMPELWAKIEARRSFVGRVKHLTQVFVAAAAAICLLFAMVLWVPSSDRPAMWGNYVDVLADSHPPENLAALGIHTDPVELNSK